MSLPNVLLVDDSDAMLAYERAALSGHYTLASAGNGRDALEKIRQMQPSAVVLDLSMPEMGGVEVLRAVRGEAPIASTPILVVSSEAHRRDECLQSGADAFMPKPVRAPDLLAEVTRLIERARDRATRGGMSVLFASVGSLRFGLPLDQVSCVVAEAATFTLPGGAPDLRELLDLHGESLLVLDTATHLGVTFNRSAVDRVFVIVEHEGRRLALRVDAVSDPQDLAPDALKVAADLGGSGIADIGRSVRAIARVDTVPIPILDARALMSGEASRFITPGSSAGWTQ
jgi:CheY-like chemotaxis protein/chemotaxis signal transduction protein